MLLDGVNLGNVKNVYSFEVVAFAVMVGLGLRLKMAPYSLYCALQLTRTGLCYMRNRVDFGTQTAPV